MAEIVVGLLSAILEIGKWGGTPLKSQFKYLCCFNTNIQTFHHAADKLRVAMDQLQARVDIEESNGRQIWSDVQNLLTRARAILAEKEGIDSNITNVEKGCLAAPSRYSLSKKTIKIAEAMEKLYDACNMYVDIDGLLLDSRKGIEEYIMNLLRYKNVNKLGICGMEGIGKTTMSKKLIGRVKLEKLFAETVFVVVSRAANLMRIQEEIAEQLGFEGLKDLDTLRERALELSARLSGTKGILIVLEDVWETLNIADLGIREDSGDCIVLFTSRKMDVLNEMNAKVYTLNPLPDSEAWLLFKEKAGERVNEENLPEIAKKVAKACRGLPISLVTIGAALKDQDKTVWEIALNRLENDVDLSSLLQFKMNFMLRPSCDFLKDEEQKSLFVGCCQYLRSPSYGPCLA